MSGVIAAVVGGSVIAGGLSYMGSQQSANAAQNAAMAQQGQAQQNLQTVLNMNQGARSLAEGTPQELNMLSQQYTAASQNLQQQQALMNSINPSLMEASKQALALLQGGTAASTTGIMQVRNQQRQQLINSLQSQYGPGAESTSVGQQALLNFDQQTQMMQQGQMNNLFGIASNGAPQQNLLNGISGLQSVGSGYSAIQNRMLNSQMAAEGDVMGVSNQLMQTAGAPYVSSALRGQGLGQIGNTIGQAGSTLGTYYGLRQLGTGANSGTGGTVMNEDGSAWNPANSEAISNQSFGSGGSWQPMSYQGNYSYNY